jgi:hypothetical protein
MGKFSWFVIKIIVLVMVKGLLELFHSQCLAGKHTKLFDVLSIIKCSHLLRS